MGHSSGTEPPHQCKTDRILTELEQVHITFFQGQPEKAQEMQEHYDSLYQVMCQTNCPLSMSEEESVAMALQTLDAQDVSFGYPSDVVDTTTSSTHTFPSFSRLCQVIKEHRDSQVPFVDFKVQGDCVSSAAQGLALVAKKFCGSENGLLQLTPQEISELPPDFIFEPIIPTHIFSVGLWDFCA